MVNDLVLENPVFLGHWSEAFRPVQNQLLAQLSEIFRDHQPERTAERSLATNLLADYVSDQSELLADLLMDADDKQFSVIYPKFEEQGERVLSFVASEIRKELLPVTTDWTVRFHKWEKVGQNNLPPTGKRSSNRRFSMKMRMCHLNIHGATDPPPPPTPKVPKGLFRSRRHDGGDARRLSITSSRPPLMMEFVCGSTTKWLLNTGGRTLRPQRVLRVRREPGRHKIKVEFIQIEGRYALDVGLSIHEEAKEKLAKRQANAAVALLRMHKPAKVWPLLKHSPDPRVRSYLIHRLGPLRADAATILKRLDSESDITIRRALILSLGEYGEKELSLENRQALLPRLQDDLPDGDRSRPSCGLPNGYCGHGSRRRG